MTSYITITDAETDPEAPLTSELAKKWRDNPLAIAEGDASVPFAYRIGHVLLGTLTTTSGSTQTLSSLDLTAFRFLRLTFIGVSNVSGSPTLRLQGVSLVTALGATASNASVRGVVDVDLFDGTAGATLGGLDGGVNVQGLASTITTATTSVSVSLSASTFDAGSIRIYGVK